MLSSWKKYPSTATFTVHSMRIPSYFPDSLQVEWKRGEFSGLTEQAFANDQNEIFFDKKFRCKVTIYVHKKTGQVREKHINFKVNRFVNGNQKKVFGDFDLDISPYFNIPPATKTYEINNLHSQKSYIVISVTISASDKPSSSSSGASTEGDLTSQSEAVVLQSDHPEEWDLSDLVGDEKDKRITEFFAPRMKEKEDRISLSDFKSNLGVKRTQNTRLRSSSTKMNENNMLIGAKIDAFMQRRPPVPAKKNSPFKGDSNAPNIFTIQEEPFESHIMDQATATNLMRSVLMKHWGESPVSSFDVPLSSIAIYLAIQYTQLLITGFYDKVIFTELIDDIVKRYQVSTLVSRSTEYDRFIITLYLISLLEKDTSLDNNLKKQLVSNLCTLCTHYLDGHIETICQPLDSIGRKLVNGLSDNEIIRSEIIKCFSSIKSLINAPKPIIDLVSIRILQLFDSHMISFLLESPMRCTLSNAISWNSFLTMIEGDGIYLPLIREAVSIFMMAQVLCTAPETSSEFCPSFPSAIVMKLLANQQPDDFQPRSNDIIAFMKYHNVQMGEIPPVPLKEIKDFLSIVEKLDISKWKNMKFDPDTLESFSYLKKFFV